MGLIKAAIDAAKSTLADQWKEAIRCEDMGNDILMMKKSTPTGVISNKSTIIVGPGQCAIIYDNGRIVDASAEEGIYTFDSSSTPSLFAGQFGGMFKEMWQRFTFNGATAKEQAVYFFNIKEIIDNKFGTDSPIMYNDWGHVIRNFSTGELTPLAMNVRCHGTYTFQIYDPFLFMSRISGTSDIYIKETITNQIMAEVIESFANLLNELGDNENRVAVTSLQSKTDEIKKLMVQREYDKSIRERGIKLVSFAIAPVTLTKESQDALERYNNGMGNMSQGKLLDVMNVAADNDKGAENGFVGIGITNMATGMFGGMNNQPVQQSSVAVQQPPQAAVQQITNHVKCQNCGADVLGKFCSECGTAVPLNTKKFCSNCGNEVEGKFCSNCGTKAE